MVLSDSQNSYSSVHILTWLTCLYDWLDWLVYPLQSTNNEVNEWSTAQLNVYIWKTESYKTWTLNDFKKK